MSSVNGQLCGLSQLHLDSSAMPRPHFFVEEVAARRVSSYCVVRCEFSNQISVEGSLLKGCGVQMRLDLHDCDEPTAGSVPHRAMVQIPTVET